MGLPGSHGDARGVLTARYGALAVRDQAALDAGNQRRACPRALPCVEHGLARRRRTDGADVAHAHGCPSGCGHRAAVSRFRRHRRGRARQGTGNHRRAEQSVTQPHQGSGQSADVGSPWLATLLGLRQGARAARPVPKLRRDHSRDFSIVEFEQSAEPFSASDRDAADHVL
jgi:hypothetical protein